MEDIVNKGKSFFISFLEKAKPNSLKNRKPKIIDFF